MHVFNLYMIHGHYFFKVQYVPVPTYFIKLILWLKNWVYTGKKYGSDFTKQ